MQEPLRGLCDISVIEAFESETLKLSDFYFTGDDYRYRFEPEARQRFIQIIRERFNSGATHNGRVLKWDTLIEQKLTELGRFLVGKTPQIDFSEPSPTLARFDDKALREQINSLTVEQAKKAGINKSTLYTLRQHTRNDRAFRLYRRTSRKLRTLALSTESS